MTLFFTNPESVTLEEVAELYESVGFGVRDHYLGEPKMLERLFGPGVFGFFARSAQGELAGFARVMSDDAVCAWIAEVCVNPSYQRNGIGTALGKLVVERFGHLVIYADGLAERNDLSFLAKLGCLPRRQLIACSRRPTTTTDFPGCP